MVTAGTPRKIDPLLQPLVTASSPREIDRRLDLLIKEHADPILLSVIRRKLKITLRRSPGARQSQEELNAEDVYSAAIAQIVGRLNTVRATPGEPIADFESYVAVVASNACDAFLRLKYPKRQLVKNRLRYLLGGHSNQTGLATWTGSRGDTLCGFQAWKEAGRSVQRNSAYQQMMATPAAFARTTLANLEARDSNAATLVSALLNRVGGPIDLDDLIQVMGEALDIKDHKPVEESDEPNEWQSERVVSPGPRISETIVGKSYLEALWHQVCELPSRQRSAVLLNLRDERGRGVIALLPILGIATVREIATALDMPASELADLWNELPLDDMSIAGRMGITRQQVINLRKVARERLGRRLADW